MIGKQEWFTRRKYGGWGIYPVTWQGWVYLALFILPFAAFQALPWWSVELRVGVTIAWGALLLFDTLHIMATMKKDERETKIEAFAERNAAYAMLAVLILSILVDAIRNGLQERFVLDPWIAAALIAGVIAKAASNLYLERTTL